MAVAVSWSDDMENDETVVQSPPAPFLDVGISSNDRAMPEPGLLFGSTPDDGGAGDDEDEVDEAGPDEAWWLFDSSSGSDMLRDRR